MFVQRVIICDDYLFIFNFMICDDLVNYTADPN